MGETKQTQKQTKKDLDEKLKLSTPSREVLEELAVACAKDPSPDHTFQYAYALSKSSEKSELRCKSNALIPGILLLLLSRTILTDSPFQNPLVIRCGNYT